MWASYGALSSTLVSTRSTVPDTFASAAARTFAATSPVRSVSVLPLNVWPPLEGSWAGRDWLVDVDDEDDDVPEVAALAMAAPLTAAAATAAKVTSLERRLPIRTPWWGEGTLRASRALVR